MLAGAGADADSSGRNEVLKKCFFIIGPPFSLAEKKQQRKEKRGVPRASLSCALMCGDDDPPPPWVV